MLIVNYRNNLNIVALFVFFLGMIAAYSLEAASRASVVPATEESIPPAPARPLRVGEERPLMTALSLDGGGARGAFPAAILSIIWSKQNIT